MAQLFATGIYTTLWTLPFRDIDGAFLAGILCCRIVHDAREQEKQRNQEKHRAFFHFNVLILRVFCQEKAQRIYPS